MHLNRTIKIQLALFTIITVVAMSVMILGYMKAPSRFFGVGRYDVTLELPSGSGLYKRANVTYSGTEIGRVNDVRLTDNGVQADLSLDSDIKIPSNLKAQVHSVSSIGEQYVALIPQDDTSAPLKDGDVIPLDRTSMPPDIAALLDSTNQGLQAIPRQNLRTVIDESYTAFGGLGPELHRLIKGSTQLAIDARKNLDPLVTLIDQSKPILDSQIETSDSITAWASHLATITGQLEQNDDSVQGFLNRGPASADQLRQLFDRLKPTLPILLANLVSVGQVAVTYQPAIEQLLVLLPQGVVNLQAGMVANMNTKQDYRGQYLDFGLNLNLPPVCSTGFMPAQQSRPPSFQDHPLRPEGDLYCRVPQDSSLLAVRGARNYPCTTVPGKRAPTVKMCESDEQYVPLNNGYNWKGDPNATLSGQAVPQLPPGSAPAPGPAAAPGPDAAIPPIDTAQYDPASGNYVGPDGNVYSQGNLATPAQQGQTWQQMLMPPAP
jgi:phospholipid/cholesterol/gamma-HCH transport system substrate-binding protein